MLGRNGLTGPTVRLPRGILRMKRNVFTCLLAFALAPCALAQDGVSTGSEARTKYLGNRGEIPASSEIAVEDFVNYHRHELPRPKSGQAVAMDVRWGNDTVREGRHSVLQVGFSTALVNDRRGLRPLNLGLVIDKSGSMADHDKLSRVKQALLALLKELRPTDRLSLIAFDSNAEVVLPSRALGNGQEAVSVIQGLGPGSSTNLEAGLRLGYDEVLKHADRESTNRVILLTDGIANEGTTEPAAIASESQSYNDRGIDLSTIGVGEDLNKDLLRTLAKSGRGLYHFIGDTEDITKVFVNEVQSLVSPVASEPDLEITYAPGLKVEQVYGFEPKTSGRTVRIHLDNMNSGMTEVVLVRFSHDAGQTKEFPVQVRLRYHDLERNKNVTLEDQAVLSSGDTGRRGELDDPAVAKNYTIAELAQSIKDMAKDCESGRYRDAEAGVAATVARTDRWYPHMEDADIKRNYDMAVKYRDLLRERYGIGESTNDDHVTFRGDERRQVSTKPDHAVRSGPNLIPNGDFSQGNKGFVSDRPYIKPSPNCLWGGYYTVVPAFNDPVWLHTNVASQPFAAPFGGKVLFMNTGGSDQFTVWSTKVSCRPHNRYRLSFQEIGLSGGRDWVNTYEIRVNGARSEAQVGGDGQYVEVAYDWDSSSSTSATVSIVRLPNVHGGGVVGIANIQMVKK